MVKTGFGRTHSCPLPFYFNPAGLRRSGCRERRRGACVRGPLPTHAVWRGCSCPAAWPDYGRGRAAPREWLDVQDRQRHRGGRALPRAARLHVHQQCASRSPSRKKLCMVRTQAELQSARRAPAHQGNNCMQSLQSRRAR